MHLAVKRGSYDAAEALIRLNSNITIDDKVCVNMQGGMEKWTPLHIAAYASYYRIVTLLINNHADMFLRNLKGKTPLGSINNNLLMIKILKKAEIASAYKFMHK